MHNIISMPSCFMIEPFKGQACEDIFNGINSQAARKACPKTLWHVAAIKLELLNSVQSLKELKIPPGNRLGASLGHRKTERCIIHRTGNENQVTDTQRPTVSLESLFGDTLPYCPDGKLPSDLPRNFLNEAGWCSDKMADGPDGMSYRVLKKNVFCTVDGHWDGGDDSDPNYVPSPLSEVTVKCASKKINGDQT